MVPSWAFCATVDLVEGNGDILLADAKETADADDCGDNTALLLQDEVVDATNAFILTVIDRLAHIGLGADLVSRLLGQIPTGLLPWLSSVPGPEPGHHFAALW